jgi:amino acid transporter
MNPFRWIGANCRLYFLLPSLALLLISTIMLIGGTFWPWGWAVGAVLFFFCGKSSSEKKGYRF